MAFFTNNIDLQAALSACLTVRDWEVLMEAVQIPENFGPLSPRAKWLIKNDGSVPPEVATAIRYQIKAYHE